MPAVVATIQVMEDLLVQFGDFFPNEPARHHFAGYMTGGPVHMTGKNPSVCEQVHGRGEVCVTRQESHRGSRRHRSFGKDDAGYSAHASRTTNESPSP